MSHVLQPVSELVSAGVPVRRAGAVSVAEEAAVAAAEAIAAEAAAGVAAEAAEAAAVMVRAATAAAAEAAVRARQTAEVAAAIAAQATAELAVKVDAGAGFGVVAEAAAAEAVADAASTSAARIAAEARHTVAQAIAAEAAAAVVAEAAATASATVIAASTAAAAAAVRARHAIEVAAKFAAEAAAGVVAEAGVAAEATLDAASAEATLDAASAEATLEAASATAEATLEAASATAEATLEAASATAEATLDAASATAEATLEAASATAEATLDAASATAEATLDAAARVPATAGHTAAEAGGLAVEPRAAEDELREKATLLDLARDAIFIRDADKHITYWNQGAETAYGWSKEEVLGRVSLDLLRTELPAPIDELEGLLRRDGYWEGELISYDRAGRRIIEASHWVPQFRGDGSLKAVMSINTDISAQKAAEKELRRRAAELDQLNRDLKRSNDDLEQFAYAASHDLAEPLRAISGPVSLIARRYQGQLDEDADRFIGFAVDGCERMQALINDLLAFSRIGRVEGRIDVLDTDKVLAAVLAVLRPTLDERAAKVEVGDLPQVRANVSQLRQLFQNLIGNSVKFTPPDVRPHVHIACRHHGDYWRFTVTDNGIGIAPQYRQRVFGMFKRLHGREDYPGTGIGLALCHKIVEWHGGEIGVDDGPGGVGSTFWFTLPTREKATA